MIISKAEYNNYSFGAKFVKNDTYKELIKLWQKKFPDASIDKALRKIHRMEPGSLKINLTKMDFGGQLQFQLSGKFKEPKKYQLKYAYSDTFSKSRNNLIYSPANVCKKIAETIRSYKKQMKKIHIDVVQNALDDIVLSMSKKHQYLYG